MLNCCKGNAAFGKSTHCICHGYWNESFIHLITILGYIQNEVEAQPKTVLFILTNITWNVEASTMYNFILFKWLCEDWQKTLPYSRCLMCYDTNVHDKPAVASCVTTRICTTNQPLPHVLRHECARQTTMFLYYIIVIHSEK